MPASVAQALATAPGAGYTHIAIAATSVDGNGSGAAFTGILSGGTLVNVLVLTQGTGYTQAPLLTVTGDGTGATAICYLTEDYKLSRLITSCSQLFLSLANRSTFIPTLCSETRNGNGANVIVPYNWPLLSVASVTANGVAVPPSPDGVRAGWVNDRYQIMLIGGGAFPRFPALMPYSFPRGFQNVVLVYTYGFAAIPFDVSQAVIELVAQKYRRAQHVDQDSQALPSGGGTVSFSRKDIPPEVQTVIDQYRIKGIIE